MTAGLSTYSHLVHADWSTRPAGRWRAVASQSSRDVWTIDVAAPVGPPEAFLDRITRAAAGRPALLGVDLPIGAPAAWAAAAGVDEFLIALDRFGQGRWEQFYEPADSPAAISLERPFYPARSGKKGEMRQRHLLDALGVEDMNAFRRRCDFSSAGAAAATPLFWTIGAAQVGKAALHFWRNVLAPARRKDGVRVWPFDGGLAELADPHRVAVAETYPAEAYGWFDLDISRPGRRKGDQAARAAVAADLFAAARRLGVRFGLAAARQVEAGFPEGDDAFDAMVGLLALIEVVSGARPEGAPDCATVRRIEGWILGREAP